MTKIIIILFCLCLLYFFIFNKSMKENFTSEPSVAIVGNGPITDIDRKLINKFDIVYRFNDCKNMEKGDKLTHLVVRQNGLKDKVHGLNYNYIPMNETNNLIFIGTRNDLFNNIKKNNNNKSCKMLEIYEPSICLNENTTCNLSKNNKIKFNNQLIKQNNSYWGPSTGFIMISDLTNKYKNLHIFGMNWNFTEKMKHNGKWEKNIINNMCQKCNIHPTAYNNYK